MEVFADEEDDLRRRLFLPCRLLRRFLPRPCPRLASSDSSLLDSEESSFDVVDVESDESDEESDEEELELDGDPGVRLAPLERPTFLNALPK